jgi:hypothetical protein
MNTDYVIFFVAALFVVIGAGLFRVGLMNLKVGSPEDIRRARLFIALGQARIHQPWHHCPFWHSTG